jgi:hypothetical protein
MKKTALMLIISVALVSCATDPNFNVDEFNMALDSAAASMRGDYATAAQINHNLAAMRRQRELQQKLEQELAKERELQQKAAQEAARERADEEFERGLIEFIRTQAAARHPSAVGAVIFLTDWKEKKGKATRMDLLEKEKAYEVFNSFNEEDKALAQKEYNFLVQRYGI